MGVLFEKQKTLLHDRSPSPLIFTSYPFDPPPPPAHLTQERRQPCRPRPTPSLMPSSSLPHTLRVRVDLKNKESTQLN